MHIYLRHFIHGSKVAISELEASYDEKSGWVRYNPEDSGNNPETVAVENQLTRRPPGRPRKIIDPGA
jgi:hypothetical protein